jgi:hypothetical protein
VRARTILAAMAIGLAVAPAAHAELISQGALRMGADVLWSRGILGQGQTVAVLDQGFQGLDDSIALGELPPRQDMTIQLFDPEAGLDGVTEFGIPTAHGTRMAEIVYDIAPDAHLVLVGYRTEAEFRQAAAWIAAQGIPIVSHSNSFLTPPFDGTGPDARAVNAAAAAGVLWVNSAGNFAQRHWRGSATAGGTVIPIAPPVGSPLLFSLGWSSPAVQASVAVERTDAAGNWVEAGRSAPSGAISAQTPPIFVDGGQWRVVVRQSAGPPAVFDLFSKTVGFASNAVADGSVATPGDAAGSLTIGAVRWNTSTIEPYSSQGPLQGSPGPAKPNLVAPTYVTSNPTKPGTAGTSASTPHVAAAAALIRQARMAAGQPATAADIRAQLVGTALDLGRPGPDPVYGAGLARLDATPPTMLVRVGGGRVPLVRVRVRDQGTLRQVRVSLNRRTLRVARRPSVAIRLTRLKKGRNRLEVRAEDMAGNVTTRVRTVIRRHR